MIIREDRAIELMVKGIKVEIKECQRQIKRCNTILEDRRLGKKDICPKTDEEIFVIGKNNQDKINLLYKEMDELKDIDLDANIELELDYGILKTSLKDMSYERRDTLIKLLDILKVEGISIDFECQALKEIENFNIWSYIFEQVNIVLEGNSDKILYLQEKLETIEVETRVCSHCKEIMIEGYCIDGGIEYYCTKNAGQIDECLEKVMTREEYNYLCYDECETYWTEWN